GYGRYHYWRYVFRPYCGNRTCSVGNVFIKCDAGNGYLDHLANSCLVHNRYPQWISGETPWPHTFIYCYYIFHILWVFLWVYHFTDNIPRYRSVYSVLSIRLAI